MKYSRNILRDLLSAWCGSDPSPTPHRPRQAELSWDCLEGRVVLSPFGFAGQRAAASRMAAIQAAQASLIGNVSVGSSLGLRGGSRDARAGFRGGAQDAELAADLEQYRTDVNAVLLGSAVTDAQRLELKNDFWSIVGKGFDVDREALAQVADDLLAALADESFTSDEQATIRNAFNVAAVGGCPRR